MAGKKKRNNKHRQAMYSGYKTFKKREHNKAKRIVKNIFASRNPEDTLKKVLLQIKNDDIKAFIKKLYEQKISV